ncbi:RNA-directed DNA polymerase, eukaryota, reverse transcriptase zinc-binding domain protein [Tanacetum coccineum]
MEGFSKFVEDTWKGCPSVGSNAMMSLMSKIRFLKCQIRVWNKSNMVSRRNAKDKIKKELEAADILIDNGNVTEEVLKDRSDLIQQLQNCDKIDSMEMAQKAKIKWAVEGDENSGFFHGIINKRRNILNIRGVMAEGTWIDRPEDVKKEFLNHFRSRFSNPGKSSAKIQLEFPNQITQDQCNNLESDVTNVEIKKAVWDCGTDKAPGPDGFTFGFFRHFWYLVDKEIYDAVSPTEEFQFGRGLKQGDPLSPFLFILIMETLHISFQRVVDAGMFHGIKLGDSVNLSHMFYADDAVFVGEWSERNITTLVHVLDCFHKASGLKIKWKARAKFTGVPMWRLDYSHFESNSVVIFLMSDIYPSKKVSWVQWNKVLASKDNGGLGVSSLFALNRGLLFKWVWRFLSQDSTLWSRVIKAIHGRDGKIGIGSINGTKSCWLSIVNEINVLAKKSINLMDFMHIKLGNGDSTAFWEDLWCADGRLKDRYPRAYSLETCKSITALKYRNWKDYCCGLGCFFNFFTGIDGFWALTGSGDFSFRRLVN